MARLTPLQALHASLKRSQAATVIVEGRPEIMFGVSPINVLAGVGGVWMLGTDVVVEHQKEFLRYSAEWRAKLFVGYSVLVNFVSVDNHASIRWLKWLGAEFAAEPITLNGVPFLPFELRK